MPTANRFSPTRPAHVPGPDLDAQSPRPSCKQPLSSHCSERGTGTFQTLTEGMTNNNQRSAIRHKQLSKGGIALRHAREAIGRSHKLRKVLQMRKSTSLLAAAIASLVIGVGLASGSNAQTAAPSSMSDEAYCQTLLKELRDHGWGTVRGRPVGNATAVAIAQCQAGG